MPNGGPLFTSTNPGSHLISNNLPNQSWGPIATSADGTKIVMVTSGAIYTSADSGQTWRTNNTPNGLNWQSPVSSADGSKLFAIGNTQLIYTTVPPTPLPALSVVGWDGNTYGQATVPNNVSNAVAIAGSAYDSAVVGSDGKVVAWGYNDIGETNVPSDLDDVVNVAISQELSLALKSDGTLGWWGWSTNTNIIPTLTNISAVAASQGDFYSALQSNGMVTAWGRNTYGQTNVPPGLSNVVAITEGGYHCLALKSDDTVAAWGGKPEGASLGRRPFPQD